jgi:hypothetical protein
MGIATGQYRIPWVLYCMPRQNQARYVDFRPAFVLIIRDAMPDLAGTEAEIGLSHMHVTVVTQACVCAGDSVAVTAARPRSSRPRLQHPGSSPVPTADIHR